MPFVKIVQQKINFLISQLKRTVSMRRWERSGSVVECLTRDGGAAGSSLTGITALCP